MPLAEAAGLRRWRRCAGKGAAGGLGVLAGREQPGTVAWEEGDQATLGDKSSHVHQEAAGDAEPGAADEDLLPPQGQGLPGIPLRGSQRGEEREGPGEQHHEGGQQQPDGEERQRHGCDLGRHVGSFQRLCGQRT